MNGRSLPCRTVIRLAIEAHIAQDFGALDLADFDTPVR
jgi:hypothetical protein